MEPQQQPAVAAAHKLRAARRPQGRKFLKWKSNPIVYQLHGVKTSRSVTKARSQEASRSFPRRLLICACPHQRD